VPHANGRRNAEIPTRPRVDQILRSVTGRQIRDPHAAVDEVESCGAGKSENGFYMLVLES
jgi:hypothetical protein